MGTIVVAAPTAASALLILNAAVLVFSESRSRILLYSIWLSDVLLINDDFTRDDLIVSDDFGEIIVTVFFRSDYFIIRLPNGAGLLSVLPPNAV